MGNETKIAIESAGKKQRDVFLDLLASYNDASSPESDVFDLPHPNLRVPTIAEIIRSGIEDECAHRSDDGELSVDECVEEIIDILVNYDFQIVKGDDDGCPIKGIQINVGLFAPYDNVDDDAQEFIKNNKSELDSVANVMTYSCGFSSAFYVFGEFNQLFLEMHF